MFGVNGSGGPNGWNERKRVLPTLNERNKSSQRPLKLVAIGQSSPRVGKLLIFSFAVRVVRIFGASLRLGSLP
jgi:hypothetical protein